MPIEIGQSRSTGDPDDPLVLLMDCHRRIRRFTQMALALARAGNEPPESIRAGAEAVARYFSEALPLHQQDEDVSLAPRLQKSAISCGPSESVDLMTLEHEKIEAVVGILVPMWRAVAENPESLAALQPRMLPHTQVMEQLWERHLPLEEQQVFPLIRTALSEEQRKEIVREMRARRSLD